MKHGQRSTGNTCMFFSIEDEEKEFKSVLIHIEVS